MMNASMRLYLLVVGLSGVCTAMQLKVLVHFMSDKIAERDLRAYV